MESSSNVPTWDGKASLFVAHGERVELYVLCTKKDNRKLCGPRVLAAMAQQSGDIDFFMLCANIPRDGLTATISWTC